MKRIQSIVSVLLLTLIIFSSCSNPNSINIGHNGINLGRLPNVAIGIRSNKTEFNVNDVTLDFSFGNESGATGCIYLDDEECPIICVAMYFYNAKYMDARNEFVDGSRYPEIAYFKDYKEIEGWHFVKSITANDYNEKCKVQFNYWGHTKYDHTETLTIPKEVFELTTGYVCFGIYEIAYIESKDSYMIYNGSHQGLKYENLEGGIVKISNAGKTLFSADVPR